VGLPVDERVLRGGSWNNNQNNARAVYRNNNNPNERNNNNGFRLVCSSPIMNR
jgi:formylglycine-generating enzyme required for sulfatase activity